MRHPLWLLCVTLAFLVSCAPAASPTPDPLANVETVKLLATVALSPTPNETERRATQAAAALAPTQPRPTPVPSATPYIGVFLGEMSGEDRAVEVVESGRFATPEALTAATVTAAACPIPPDPRYGQAWASDPDVAAVLSCAGETAADYPGSSQVFENGLMIYIPSGEIWVIARGTPNNRYWYVVEAPPSQPIEATAPEGLRIPTLGFGAVWAGIPGVRQALGFARTDEVNTSVIVQRFIGGTLIQDASVGQTFIILGSAGEGTAYGPF